MKRKGQIILVTMLAVIFMATTVHAGGSWWNHALDKMWHKVEKKIHKIEKQTKRNARKIKHNSRRIRKNSRKISRLDRKVARKHNRWHKKKKHKNNPKTGVDMETLKAQILAELKADEAFKAQLKGEKGEKGDKGDPGEKGEDGKSGTFISHWESFSKYNGERLDLAGVNLKGSRILESYFYDSNLEGANLVEARLDGSIFASMNSVTSLAGADLTDATVVNADFTGVDFTGANLTGVDLSTAYSVAGAIWTNATCPDGQLAEVHGGSCEGVNPIP